MAPATNAILFYGYCWTEHASYPWEIGGVDDAANAADTDDSDDGSWETRYARMRGCPPPSAPFPTRMVQATRENGWSTTPKDYNAGEQAIIDQHTAYWEAKEAIVDAATCCIDTHCSEECPMPYVAVKASQTVSRLEITSLKADPTWDGALTEFCTSMGIKTDGLKATWWLVSYWSGG